MNGLVHDPHAHRGISINELLNPVASSTAIDHGLPSLSSFYYDPSENSYQDPPSMAVDIQQEYPFDLSLSAMTFAELDQTSSCSNGHYTQNTTYTHPTMPPHHRTANGTAYKLNPANCDGADHDRQRVDHMPSPRGFAPGVLHSPGAYQEYHAHLSRTHEDGFSEPSAVWSSPTGRLDGLPAYASPTITQSSYSDERTSIPNNPAATAGSSPYPSRPDSATYGHPELHPSAYSQRPPQTAAVFGAWPHPPHPYPPHPAFYSPLPYPGMLYPYMVHPYPPPPPPPSRRRTGPEEIQNPRSKRKRLNEMDTIETNGSRRGYTTNRRIRAAQIAAQNVVNTQPSSTQGHVSESTSKPSPSANGERNQTAPISAQNVVNTQPSSTQGHVSTSQSSPSAIGSQRSYTANKRSQAAEIAVQNVVNTQPSSRRRHVSTSQSSPSCIPGPPEKLHPTMSCWIKNMKKLSSLIDRLQELASSAPTEHQSQLFGQVEALRVTSKKQQEQFMDFLRLSEEYANEYLLDIDAYIQQQSSFLAKLERRLEAAKKLRGEAAELQRLYESGTVATMENLRATALPRPLPEDHALFREVDSVLTEIKQCYAELYKFWTMEISRAMEAFKKRRVDRTDFERWRSFHVNLKQTIESWNGELSSGDAQTVLHDNAYSSEEADIGVIASSLSSAMSSVTSALESVPSTNSLKYLSSSCQSSIQRVYLALRGNRDLCLSFLQRCADYGEQVIDCHLSSTAFHTPFRVMDLREWTTRLLSERTDVSVENVASVQGLRKFKAAYKKARSLEETTTSGLNTLQSLLGSWTTVTDGHAFPDDDDDGDIITPEQLRELWEKARYSVHAVLANLKDEPAPQLFYQSASLVSTRLQSVVRRWMIKLVFFS